MAKSYPLYTATASVLLILPAYLSAQSGLGQGNPSPEWLTWGYDQERTGWNRAETILSKDNVPRLELKWTAQLTTKPEEVVLATETSPLVVDVNTPQGRKTLVFVVGSDDTIFAIDAANGNFVWQKRFPNNTPPKQMATWLCSNTQNATPVIDKQNGIIYLTTSDGKLRGVSVSNGEDRFPPTDFITPNARNWSLNLIDGVIYTTIARGCGGAIANFAAMDVSDPSHAQAHFYTSTGRPAGAWGRGGAVKGPKGIITQTADGPYDPASGQFGETVMDLSFKDLRLLDSFTPSNWQYLNVKDLDMGSAGPVVFPFQKWTLVASAAKEGVIYLLDANALGGGPNPNDRTAPAEHSTPLYQSARWGNDEVLLWGHGLWGAMATAEVQGQRWLYMPMWGPPAKDAPAFQYTYGDAERGSVMGFQVTVQNDKPALTPVWRSRDMQVPDPPVVANGVVYAIQTGENTRQGGDGPAGGGRGAAAGQGGGGRGGAGRGGVDAAAAGAQGGDAGRGGAGAGVPGGGRGRGGRGGAAAAAAAAHMRATPITNLVLYAYDAQTGKELYSSDNIITNWVHYSEPVVSGGQVYVVSWDAHVYCFGLKQ
jgi:outer membrane protein assembly factor BamB